MLGYKQLAWKSVIIPAIMPKPDVLALTGGYRKTPFLQIGNDIYCDSALICDVLEHVQPTPTLYPDSAQGRGPRAGPVGRHHAVLGRHGLQPAAQGRCRHVCQGAPPEAAKAFGADRAAMSAGMNRLRPADATAAYKIVFAPFGQYAGRPGFPAGQRALRGRLCRLPPAVVYREVRAGDGRHSERHARRAGLDGPHGRTGPWADGEVLCYRIHSCLPQHSTGATAPFGHDADATFQDEHGIPLGSQVTISAEVFGQEPTTGELVAATRTRFTLKRVDERAGTVQVHFPRIGYVLKAVQPA